MPSTPIYVWGNTLNGSSNNTTTGSTNVANNRDYYVGTARPGYTPYTYPNPLQATGTGAGGRCGRCGSHRRSLEPPGHASLICAHGYRYTGAFSKTAPFWIVQEEAMQEFQGQHLMNFGGVVPVSLEVAPHYGF